MTTEVKAYVSPDHMNQGIQWNVTIKVEEKSFLVYKHILATSSNYFREIFDYRQRKSHMTEIRLYDIQATTFESILDYIYTGKIEISKKNVKDLWIASDVYEFFDVREKTENFIIETLKKKIETGEYDRSFSMDLWHTASSMQNTCVLTYFNKYIGKTLKNIILTEEFLDLDADDLLDLIGSDFLWAETEEIVFQAGMRWIKYLKEERIDYLPEILAKIRLNLLSSSFLSSHVLTDQLIQDSSECKEWIESHLNNSSKISQSRKNDQDGDISRGS